MSLVTEFDDVEIQDHDHRKISINAISDISSDELVRNARKSANAHIERIPEKYREINSNMLDFGTDMASIKSSNNVQSKDIANLKSVMEGNLYTLLIDDDLAYSKAVPNNALSTAAMDKFGGSAMVINQIMSSKRSVSTHGVEFAYNAATGELKISATGDARDGIAYWESSSSAEYVEFVTGHKYMIAGIENLRARTSAYIPKGTAADGTAVAYFKSTSGEINPIIEVSNRSSYLSIRVEADCDLETPIVVYPRIFDLTRMFGENLPDNITPEEAYARGCPRVFVPFTQASIVTADVDAIVSEDTTIIPEAIRNLRGYGWAAGSVYNEVNFETRKYIQRVEVVDLSTLTWQKGSTSTIVDVEYRYRSRNVYENAKKPVDHDHVANILCPIYPAMSSIQTYRGDIGVSIGADGCIYIYTGYDDLDAFLEQIRGVPLYYELNEYNEIDISDKISNETGIIKVEGGSNITFHQSICELHVPNQETYLVRNSEVMG